VVAEGVEDVMVSLKTMSQGMVDLGWGGSLTLVGRQTQEEPRAPEEAQ